MRAFITGGTGFVGGALVRLLLKKDYDVVALARPGADRRMLNGLPVNVVEGTLYDADALARQMEGCDEVYHVAALYAYWGYAWDEFYRSNVEGTRGVLEAALKAGVKCAVHTSTIAVMGRPLSGDTADENTPSSYAMMVSDYKRSKYLAEDVAREYAGRGLPVVIVNPAAPIGAGDWKPTATGKIVVDYLNGRMPAYVHSKQNMVDVDDVAMGHLLAAQKGRPGERYILGGENLTLKRFLDILSEVSGLPPVGVRMPVAVALGWAYIDITLGKLIKGYTPAASPAAVRTGMVHTYYDSGKAMRELGYAPSPAKVAAQKAIDWYRANGYVKRNGA